jgi:hypothetical protein
MGLMDDYNKRCTVCEGICEDNTKNLCNTCESLNSTPTGKKEKQKRVKSNPLPKPKYIKLHCTKCQKDIEIRTNKPEIYTDEVKKVWVCFLCSGYKKVKTTEEVQNGPTEVSNPVPEQ